MSKSGRTSKAKTVAVAESAISSDSSDGTSNDDSLQEEQKEQEDPETRILATVAAAELVAAEAGPDPDSLALITSTLRSQGMRPMPSDDPKGVKCPECGTALVIAPKGGHTYVVCYSALSGEGGCWYYRELPPKKK